MLVRSVAVAGILVAVCGCTKPAPIYRWGNYENVVYATYAYPGTADPTTSVALLSEDIERTSAEGKRVPPGVHAHLGFLYYSQGRADAARGHFEMERELFPESAIFIDGILEKMASR
jgi:hypothetical protein